MVLAVLSRIGGQYQPGTMNLGSIHDSTRDLDLEHLSCFLFHVLFHSSCN